MNLLASLTLTDPLQTAGLFGMFLGLGGLGLILIYFIFDWVTPKIAIQEELNKGNMAVGVVVAALLVAAAIIAHAAMS